MAATPHFSLHSMSYSRFKAYTMQVPNTICRRKLHCIAHERVMSNMRENMAINKMELSNIYFDHDYDKWSKTFRIYNICEIQHRFG